MSHNKSLLTGIALGTLFALMFAPQKGKHIRENIQKAQNLGTNGLEPLAKGIADLFSEFFRVVHKYIPNEPSERNPFTITNISNYVRKKI